MLIAIETKKMLAFPEIPEAFTCAVSGPTKYETSREIGTCRPLLITIIPAGIGYSISGIPNANRISSSFANFTDFAYSDWHLHRSIAPNVIPVERGNLL